MSLRGSQLLELQESEEQLRKEIALYKKLEKMLAEETPVAKARLVYEAAEQAGHQARTQQTDLNLQLQQKQDQIAREEQVLYGEVKAAREVQNLQLEVEMLKSQHAKLEEQALTLMEEIEAITQSAETAKTSYENVAAENMSRTQELESKMAAIRKSVSRRKKAREKIIATIAPRDLEQYHYVQGIKGGTVAVARIDDGVCQACHIEVSAAKREVVERDTEGQLATCGNCGRILVTV